MNSLPINIEISPAEESSRWHPKIGQECQDLLDYFSTKISNTECQALQESSLEILGKCGNPRDDISTRTGLVVGYVQSGKTMSFTTVAALATDNECPLVIVITGTTIPLFEQSCRRLSKDLRLDDRDDRKWQYFQEPDKKERERLSQVFDDWRDPTTPTNDRGHVLIAVKKYWSVLRKLIDLLKALDLRGISALIIDDEADQASLNTKVRRQEESTTYARLLNLRRLFKNHTFLQYTATPQAPLLISILDVQSPDFSALLTPGSAYVGGIEFFDPESNRILSILDVNPQQLNSSPPDSLIEAMRFFFLGVAAGKFEGGRGNRSMLIHPSRETDPQGDFAHWVRQIKDRWVSAFSLSETDSLYLEEYEEFEKVYEDLLILVGSNIPSFPNLISVLKREIRKTNVAEVNSTTRKGDVNWKASYAWILIGGQALDRGFTVEGLTVTYMPRGIGGGNADTLQQRARFFGYKRPYLGYCRVYLDPTVRSAFSAYVDHEEHVRLQLEEWQRTGRPVQEWKRAFLIDRSLQPTRRNVLSSDHLRDSYSDKWFWIRSPHEFEDSISENRRLFDDILSRFHFVDLPENVFRTPARRHSVVKSISLRDIYDNLLSLLHVRAPDDGQRYFGALLQIQEHLFNFPSETCDVFLVSPYEARSRAVNSMTDEIDQLFSGANGTVGEADYDPGDRKLYTEGVLSIQLHRLNLTDAGQRISSDVPVIAIWVPAVMANDWLVQDV